MKIELMYFVVLGICIFSIGLCGIMINRKSIINLLMSMELMLLGTNINMVSFSSYLKDISGQIFVIMVMTVAAAEAAIGLAIMLVYFKNRNTIDISDINHLRG